MKNELEEKMLEAIFVKTGGRPENPKIAEVCAEIAAKAISTNTISEDSLPDYVKYLQDRLRDWHIAFNGYERWKEINTTIKTT